MATLLDACLQFLLYKILLQYLIRNGQLLEFIIHGYFYRNISSKCLNICNLQLF